MTLKSKLHNLNTLYVDIKQLFQAQQRFRHYHLNTLYVDIKRFMEQALNGRSNIFKYIIC